MKSGHTKIFNASWVSAEPWHRGLLILLPFARELLRLGDHALYRHLN